jgi:ABC-type transport system involved in multi-copper enzyme maturation permease subunit
MAPAPHRSAPREFIGGIATIMTKELRSRMRGRRAFVLLTIYLGLLALITYAVYLIAAPTAGVNLGPANASAIVGQSIFVVLSLFQLILICFIAPAATAGQISLEREKQTLDLLVSTPMRPGAIVVGKLAAALAYVVLMIVAAVPITAIVLMYGGVTVGDIVRQQVVLLAVAAALGAIGLFYSALLKRTQAATVLTYITVLALTLGTTAVFVFWTIFSNQTDSGFIPDPEPAPEVLLYVNPGVAMVDVIAVSGGDPGLDSFLRQMRGDDAVAPPDAGAGEGVVCDANGCVPARPDALGNVDEGAGYWWPRIVITLLALAVILTIAAMRLVAPAGMRGIGRRRSRRAVATPSLDIEEEAT